MDAFNKRDRDALGDAAGAMNKRRKPGAPVVQPPAGDFGQRLKTERWNRFTNSLFDTKAIVTDTAERDQLKLRR